MKPIHYTHGMICGALDLLRIRRLRNAIHPQAPSEAFYNGFDRIADIPVTLDQVRRRLSR
jgi:hypothetical protein